MLRARLTRIAASAFILGLSVLIMGGQNQSQSGAFDERILWSHNLERAAKGIAPLTWDNQLRDAAQSWANHLASTGTFEHAYDDSDEPTGENLWAGTQGYYTPEAMVNGWIEEKRLFKQGIFPDNSVTGDVSDVGHYTQVMWRDTIDVGCGKAAGHGKEILVCRYKNAGNYEGERPF
jgi:hypothetical protein